MNYIYLRCCYGTNIWNDTFNKKALKSSFPPAVPKAILKIIAILYQQNIGLLENELDSQPNITTSPKGYSKYLKLFLQQSLQYSELFLS